MREMIKSLEHEKVSSYIIRYISRSGRVDYAICENQVCHSELFSFNYPAKEITGYISKCKLNPSYRVAGRKYLKWVLTKSPWSFVYKTKTLKEAYEIGVEFKVNVPMNLIAFGTIAYRISYEHQYARDFPKQISLWYEAVKEGADPLVMFTFLTCMDVGKTSLTFNRGGNLHGPIYWDGLKVGHLKKFYEGEIPYKSSTLFQNATTGTDRTVFDTLRRGAVNDRKSAFEVLNSLQAEDMDMVDGWSGKKKNVNGVRIKDLPKFTHKFKEVICQ